MKLVPMPEHVDGTEGVGKYISSPKRRRIKLSKALRISAGNVARITVEPLGCFESRRKRKFVYVQNMCCSERNGCSSECILRVKIVVLTEDIENAVIVAKGQHVVDIIMNQGIYKWLSLSHSWRQAANHYSSSSNGYCGISRSILCEAGIRCDSYRSEDNEVSVFVETVICYSDY